MATIYRKTNLNPSQPSGYDNMLILDPQESILYPFDIGDYNEVRVGVIWTFTSATGNNTGMVAVAQGTILESTYATGSRHPRKSFYAGLNNNKLSLPYTSGTNFIGIGIWSGTSNPVNYLMGGYDGTWALSIANSQAQSHGAIDLLLTNNVTSFSGGSLSKDGDPGGFGGIFAFNTSNVVGGPITQYRDGSDGNQINYGFFQLQYTFTQNSNDKTVYSVRCVTSPYVYDANVYDRRFYDSSNRTIKFLNSQPSTMAYGPTKTGYWTADGTSGTSNLDKPTAFFLYNPFFLYRPRISNIIVEKYA